MLGHLVILQTAAASVTAVVRPLSAIQLLGEGRRKFLHGLCTNDINNLALDGVLDASVVDASGRLTDLITVVDRPEALVAFTAPEGRGAELCQSFDRYAFPADRVTVEDVTGTFGCACEISGVGAAALLADALEVPTEQLPRTGCAASLCSSLSPSPVLVLGSGSLGFEDEEVYSILGPSADASDDDSGLIAMLLAAVREAGGAVEASYERMRVQRGRPARGYEYGRAGGAKEDAPTPLELGLWSSVHLDKGCYMGQEVLARLARVKKPKKALYGIRFDASEHPAAPLEAGATVEVEGEGGGGGEDAGGGDLLSAARSPVAGVLTSVVVDPKTNVPMYGLAMVQPSRAAVGSRVTVAAGVAAGEVVEIEAATRFGAQAGGGLEPSATTEVDAAAQAAAVAASAAEAERKKKKLEAMAQRMKDLGLA